MGNEYHNLLHRYITHSDEKEMALKQIQKHLPRPKPLSILDVGCGSGMISNALAEAGHTVVAIDSQDIRESLSGRVQFIKTDVFEYQPDRAYDCIIAAYLFWEIPFDKWDQLFEQFFSWLTPDGKIVVIDSVNTTPYNNVFVDFNLHQDVSSSETVDWYQYLARKNITYEKHLFNTHVTAQSSEEMYEILEFFFQGNKHDVYVAEKQWFLDSFQRKERDGEIVLTMQQELDVITQNNVA